MPGAASTYSDPEFSWLEQVAPTAILFPRGLSSLYDGMALVGDANNGDLYRFPLNAGRTGFDLSSVTGLTDLVADDATEVSAVRIGRGFFALADLKQGPDGAVYVVSLGAGEIYRIAAKKASGRTYYTTAPVGSRTPAPGSPCRSGVERLFTLVGGACGVPATARALALNVTVTGATGSGYLTLFPGNLTTPLASTVNFSAGQTRANNAVTALSTDGLGQDEGDRGDDRRGGPPDHRRGRLLRVAPEKERGAPGLRARAPRSERGSLSLTSWPQPSRRPRPGARPCRCHGRAG